MLRCHSLLHGVLPGRVARLSGLSRALRSFSGVTEWAFGLPLRAWRVPGVQEADSFHVVLGSFVGSRPRLSARLLG
jgi:hypothetical protein